MASGVPRLHMEVRPHHEQRRICASRAKYREGRRPRAVRVYTINLESRYLLVQGVPAIGVMKELVEQFALYGAIEEYNVLDEYPTEEFTEVYLIKFQRTQSARVAKRKQDERSFFGGLLHVCYAPEFESVQETREKLQERRRYVARATSDKEHGVAKKRQEVPESSTLVPVHSAVNCAHTSSYHTPVQSGDPSTPFSAPPPSVTPDYRHEYCPPPSQTPDSRYEYYPPPSVTPDCRYEYYPPPSVTPDYKHEYHPPSHSIAWDSRNESKDNAHQTERPVGPPQGPPNIMSSTRFMPRTTQLQERQRKREERTRLDLLLPESQEIVIGPKLPEIPKLDMTDDSLNISADLIRAKLKEGSASCTLTRTEPPTEDPPAAPLAKQRRRI